MNRFVKIYRKYLFKYAINPFSYFIALVLVFFAAGQFFVAQNFFSETGSTDLRVFFSGIPYVCILVVPALTAMIPFTQEEFSYPVKTAVLPAVKILAVSTVILLSIVLTIFVPIAVSVFGDVQFSQILCGYIGIILYVFATVSASVFVFTLVKNAGVAFIVSALILAVINSSHLVSLYFNLPSWLSALVKGMSFAWHFDAAGKGIIDSRDLVFYVALILLFFVLSWLVLEKIRGNKTFYTKKILLLSMLTFVLVIADSSRLYFRVDTTSSKQFSVTKYSKEILDQVEEPLTISYYCSEALRDLYPQVRDVRDFLEEYATTNRNVSFKYYDPVKEDAVARLKNYGVYGQQIDSSGRGDSTTMVYSAVVISYLEKIEVIPFILDTSTLEFDLTSRIQAMVVGSTRLVQIVTGNGMDLNEDYSYIEPWLQSLGFVTVHTYRPSEILDDDFIGSINVSFDMLPEIPMLVLGTSYFNQQDTMALENFLLNGGKAFVCTTPYTVDIANDWGVNPIPDNVIYLLQKYGMYFKETLTADISNFRITFYSDTTTSGSSATPETEYANYPLWPVLQPQTYALKGLTSFWPCAIDVDEEVAEESKVSLKNLLLTTNSAWQIAQVDGKFYTNPFTIQQAPEGDDQFGQFSICTSCDFLNGNNGKLVLFGDQYAYTKLMFNYAAGSVGDMRSLDFLTDIMLTLNGQEQILPLKNRSYINTSLYKVDNVSMGSTKLTILLLTCGTPFIMLMLAFGLVVFYRKQYNTANNFRKENK